MPDASQQDFDRGRQATSPTQIPAPGWKDVALRVKDDLGNDNVSIIAAGVAFYTLLSIVPALAAIVAIYGIFANPQQAGQEIASAGSVIPSEASNLIQEQMSRLAGSSSGALGAGAVIAVLLSLWSATSGTKAMITALGIAYHQPDKRGFLKFNALALAFTVGMVVFVLLALGFVAAVPVALGSLGLGSVVNWVVTILRWPILLGVVLLALAVLYRYGPDRDEARWRWLTPGAVTASLLWLVASIAFSIYVSHFGSYNKTYGSLGAVVVLMTWLYLSAYVVLLGAETNSEIERQTAQDSTIGPPRPLGQRGAYAADTLGPQKEGPEKDKDARGRT